VAAALAADGQFDRAADAIQTALDSVPLGDVPAGMLQRQALYKRRQPYFEPAGSAPALGVVPKS
jgi:hypothetical protein